MKPIFWLVLALVLSAVVGGYALRDDAEVPEVVAPAPVAEPVVREAPKAVAKAEPKVVAAPSVEPPPADDDVLRIDLTGNASFFELFDQLGIEDYEGQLAKWGVERGYPQLDDQGNPILDQPYEQYDDATLRAFADGDDMWAQQFLADRIKDSNPAEALEWYRKAAVNGSVHAMTEMARLYRDLAYSKAGTQATGEAARTQLESFRSSAGSPAIEGYAWAAVAERAGWDPLRGGMTAGFVGAKLSEKQKEAACQMAGGLFDGLVNDRQERGLGDYSAAPPPIVFDPGTVGGTSCASNATPNYEEQCREVQVVVGGEVSRLWTCGQ
ncbi:MAG: hypothetical protein AB8G16_02590 [Gammaproteobacteria bacterium]